MGRIRPYLNVYLRFCHFKITFDWRGLRMRAVPGATSRKPVWCRHSRLSNRAADRPARRLAVSHACLTDFGAMNEASRRPTVARAIRYGSAPLAPAWAPPAPTSPKQPRLGCRHETESPWVQESPPRPLATVSPRQGPPPEIPACLREPTEYIESNGIASRTGRRAEARPVRREKGEMRCKNTDSWEPRR